MMNEYKIYIIGNIEQINEMLQLAQRDELIDSYHIEDD